MTALEYRLHLIPAAARTATAPTAPRTGKPATTILRPHPHRTAASGAPTNPGRPATFARPVKPGNPAAPADHDRPARSAGHTARAAAGTGSTVLPTSRAEQQLAALIDACPQTSTRRQLRQHRHPVHRLHPFLYPHGELAERARRYRQEREAAQAIPRIHLPVWRWRVAVIAGILPIMWALPRCRTTGCTHWPCKPLLDHLHQTHGWGPKVDQILKSLSTKRRRARAARRNPTAVSHRAGRSRSAGRTAAAAR